MNAILDGLLNFPSAENAQLSGGTLNQQGSGKIPTLRRPSATVGDFVSLRREEELKFVRELRL